MDKLIIKGGHKVIGEIEISSAKNSVLPIIACCILSKEEIIIKNCPKISDIMNMLNIIKNIGGSAEFIGNDIHISCLNANPKLVESNLTGQIRSSIFILGPILSRFKYADISYPGGCEIGLRPIDLHILGLKCLNVKITEKDGMIECDGSEISGGVVNLDFPSVGATENIMMAGVLTEGTTVIRNAAREPEIVDLANFINYLGGKIHGAGSGIITIEGVQSLKGGTYSPISDRIVAGTYMAACAMCGGKLKMTNVNLENIYSIASLVMRSGCEVEETNDGIIVKSSGKIKAIHKIETQPYPGFPTDCQAQILTMLTVSDGYSIIVENLFESRFKHTVQLVKMGANITVKDRIAMIKGVKELHGANVLAEDLRGGAALVMAGLRANGTTIVSNVQHIDRGYYKIEDDLNSIGGEIERIPCL